MHPGSHEGLTEARNRSSSIHSASSNAPLASSQMNLTQNASFSAQSGYTVFQASAKPSSAAPSNRSSIKSPLPVVGYVRYAQNMRPGKIPASKSSKAQDTKLLPQQNPASPSLSSTGNISAMSQQQRATTPTHRKTPPISRLNSKSSTEFFPDESFLTQGANPFRSAALTTEYLQLLQFNDSSPSISRPGTAGTVSTKGFEKSPPTPGVNRDYQSYASGLSHEAFVSAPVDTFRFETVGKDEDSKFPSQLFNSLKNPARRDNASLECWVDQLLLFDAPILECVKKFKSEKVFAKSSKREYGPLLMDDVQNTSLVGDLYELTKKKINLSPRSKAGGIAGNSPSRGSSPPGTLQDTVEQDYSEEPAPPESPDTDSLAELDTCMDVMSVAFYETIKQVTKLSISHARILARIWTSSIEKMSEFLKYMADLEKKTTHARRIVEATHQQNERLQSQVKYMHDLLAYRVGELKLLKEELEVLRNKCARNDDITQEIILKHRQEVEDLEAKHRYHLERQMEDFDEQFQMAIKMRQSEFQQFVLENDYAPLVESLKEVENSPRSSNNDEQEKENILEVVGQDLTTKDQAIIIRRSNDGVFSKHFVEYNQEYCQTDVIEIEERTLEVLEENTVSELTSFNITVGSKDSEGLGKPIRRKSSNTRKKIGEITRGSSSGMLQPPTLRKQPSRIVQIPKSFEIFLRTLRSTYIPKAKTPKMLMKQVSDILFAKLEADEKDDKENHPRQPLNEFVYDFFLNKCGLRTAADEALIDFLSSLKATSLPNYRCGDFAFLVGLTTDEEVTPEATNFYLKPYVYLKTRLGSKGNMMELKSVNHVLAKDIIFSLFSRAEQEETRESLLKQVYQFSVGDNLDFDLFTHLFMTHWIQQDAEERKLMELLFQAADINRDSVLCFEEFVAAVRTLDPNISIRSALKMFRELNVGEDDVISVSNFVTVLRRKNLHPSILLGKARTFGTF
eukprot:TRINITY_DN3666_c0_g3_i4.p1 TRINITY_DN3666_c0_g3~~TRINITY_DN3666_c0_g3_i4.p1  ORF type:complete len:964 (-),score=147.62 TRINITY_DN3666_c0_g3_i4:117-3008(-)